MTEPRAEHYTHIHWAMADGGTIPYAAWGSSTDAFLMPFVDMTDNEVDESEGE